MHQSERMRDADYLVGGRIRQFMFEFVKRSDGFLYSIPQGDAVVELGPASGGAEKAYPIETVVDHRALGREVDDTAGETGEKRQQEVAMGDCDSVRPSTCTRLIHMDPLMITGHISERRNALLSDRNGTGMAEFRADCHAMQSGRHIDWRAHRAPPLMYSVCPETYDASSDARNAIVAATSSEVPTRPSGVRSATSRW